MNRNSKIQCFSCKEWFFIKGRVKKGVIVECPKCGKKFICIDHNKYIDRWRDYNDIQEKEI